MKAMLLFIGWLILLALSWPLALAALLLWPIIFLLSIPLAIIGISLSALFALLKAVLFLPARVFGYRG